MSSVSRIVSRICRLGQDPLDNVLIFQLFQKADLPNGSGWHTLVLGLESNLLQSNQLIRVHVSSLVDNAIGT
jgi:hypothetical protein